MECLESRDNTTPEVTQVVVELLRQGLGRLATDREQAAQLISKACAVLMTARGAPKDDGVVRGALLPWQVRKVRAHIDANLDKPLLVPELSALVGLGPSYFQRAFKKSLGVSPHAFILERRIRRAQTLMLTTPQSLSLIARASGFSDQSHLTTRFHCAVGVTPSVWRRTNRGESESASQGEGSLVSRLSCSDARREVSSPRHS